MYASPTPGELQIRYGGVAPTSDVTLHDGTTSYSLGRRSVRSVVRGLRSPAGVAALTAVWEHVSRRIRHLCSSGSPLDEVHAAETLLHHYYSYSFGCCRDVNLLLAALLTEVGFEVRPLGSPYHVALQVHTDGGPYYADADELHATLTRGSIEELARLPREPFIFFRASAPGPTVPATPDTFDWEWWPGDACTFGSQRPRLLFRPMEPLDPFNLGADPYHRHAAAGTRVGDAWLTLPPRAAGRGRDSRGAWTDFEVASPFVLLSADLTGFAGSSAGVYLVVTDTSGASREVPVTSSRFFVKALQPILAEGTIAPDEMLSNWGGHARRVVLVDLEGRIVTDTSAPELGEPVPSSFRLFEDDRELGPQVHGPMPTGAHREAPTNREIIETGGGRYRVYQAAHLVFSSSDGSDPATNGRTYRYRVTAYPPAWSAFDVRGRYRFGFRIRHEDPLPSSARIHLRFQYNRAIMPDWRVARLEAEAPGFTLTAVPQPAERPGPTA